ncbi:MAG TPA: class I SAM-dependent methyltransferase [Nanoarchaeota archaeon]|nr:class I SAM-dependent methyltransferase [Nanoarchaeota archaeon]
MMKLYTTKAQFYDRMAQSAGKHYIDEAKLIGKIIQDNANGNRVLDLGCGTGAHAAELIKLGFKVLCSDLSKEMLAIAKKKTGAECLKMDMRRFSLRTKVDAVICLYNTIMYNRNGEELKSTFNACHGCLNPGGVLIIQVISPNLLRKAKDSTFLWDLSKKDKLIQSTFIQFPKLTNHFTFLNTRSKIEESDWHEMRIFPLNAIKEVLKNTGFDCIRTIKDKTTVYIICRRQ